MTRYIVYFRDSVAFDETHRRIVETPGVNVLDETSTRAMLIETSKEVVKSLQTLDRVVVTEETTYPTPELPRPEPRN